MAMTIAMDACLNFGKYRNKPVEEVLKKDPSYLLWLFYSGYEGGWERAVIEGICGWVFNNPAAAKKTIGFAVNSCVRQNKSPVTVDIGALIKDGDGGGAIYFAYPAPTHEGAPAVSRASMPPTALTLTPEMQALRGTW